MRVLQNISFIFSHMFYNIKNIGWNKCLIFTDQIFSRFLKMIFVLLNTLYCKTIVNIITVDLWLKKIIRKFVYCLEDTWHRSFQVFSSFWSQQLYAVKQMLSYSHVFLISTHRMFIHASSMPLTCNFDISSEFLKNVTTCCKCCNIALLSNSTV